MKEKIKKIVKGMTVIAVAVSVILGSVSTPMKVEAKGTAFINKKVSSVTPTIKSAKRSKGKVTVTVSVPTSKVKKLGNVKRFSIAYGSTKNSRKFEAKMIRADNRPMYNHKVLNGIAITKIGKNQYRFTLDNVELLKYKNAYITVRFDGKSNWSKLVKVSGKATKPSYKMPRRDKDGTYTKSILKRFDQGEWQGQRYQDICGAFDDGDGWVVVTVPGGKCNVCSEYMFCFTTAVRNSKAYNDSWCGCSGTNVSSLIQLAFDTKAGKVVCGTENALSRYPVGTFFMEVE